jgi:NAD(P)-dependent dehydrogenase (short-subunit alcohol dehydrogenase family)
MPVEGPREVVVVTGTGGMGRAIARRLGAGRILVLADASDEQLRDTADGLRDTGFDVHPVSVDVSSRRDVAELAASASGLGTIRSVVHTAGVSPVQATPQQIVDVDVIGTALILDAFEPLVEPGTVGVCISSMAGTMTTLPPDVVRLLSVTPTERLHALPLLDPTAMNSGEAYGLAKRANQARVLAASLSWGRRGGRVVSLSPGVISTPMGRAELSGPSGEFMRQMIGMSGTHRVGTPEDIAAAVEFLVSPAASFITGTDLLVDGGATAALAVSAGADGQ